MEGLRQSEGSLELLHLPCLDVETRNPGSLSYECIVRGVDLAAMNFSKLQTLSMGGREKPCFEWCYGQMNSMFRLNVATIRTLYLAWTTTSWLSLDGWYEDPLIAINLTKIHLVGAQILKNMDKFLIAAPQLRQLVINAEPSPLKSPMALEENHISHEMLQEFVLIISRAAAYTAIFDVYPLFLKLETGHLPGLKKVILRGPYPGVRLGYTGISTGIELQAWKDAAKICTDRGVNIRDEQDTCLYIWHARFATTSSEDSETDTLEESRSQEMNSSEFETSSIGDEAISDDSQDGPYRYISRRDVDYDTDYDSDDSST